MTHLADEDVVVAKRQQLGVLGVPPAAPLVKCHRIVHPDVLAVRHTQRRCSALGALHHGGHARQVASGKDVCSDEVAAGCVCLIPLILPRDHLGAQTRKTRRLEELDPF